MHTTGEMDLVAKVRTESNVRVWGSRSAYEEDTALWPG